VATLPHRGSFVAQLALKDFLEINQIRALIEPFAVRQATGQIPPAVLAELERRLRGLNRAQPGPAEYAELHVIDAAIHRAIGDYAGNARLDDLAEHLRSLCQQFSYDSQLRYEVMIDELLALLAAIGQGDADAAETLMREHINNFSAALPRMVAR
jgi:DNA-binding GntR family transcriptional regulator